MNTFNYDNLRLALEATVNAKKAMDDLVKKIEHQRPYIEDLFNKIELIQKSNLNLLSRLKSNQNGSNNSHLIY